MRITEENVALYGVPNFGDIRVFKKCYVEHNDSKYVVEAVVLDSGHGYEGPGSEDEMLKYAIGEIVATLKEKKEDLTMRLREINNAVKSLEDINTWERKSFNTEIKEKGRKE